MSHSRSWGWNVRDGGHGFRRRLGHLHVGAHLPEHLGHRLPRRQVVVHDQDAQVLERMAAGRGDLAARLEHDRPTARGHVRHVHERERHREGGPFPGPGAVGLDHPAVLLDEMANDRQAEAEAAVQACVGGVGLGKAIEDVGQEPGIDAGPGVAHLEAGAPVHLLEGDAM